MIDDLEISKIIIGGKNKKYRKSENPQFLSRVSGNWNFEEYYSEMTILQRKNLKIQKN